MMLNRVPGATIKAMAIVGLGIVGLGVQADAKTPCPEVVRLRNAATEAWKQAMRAPQSDWCGALHQAALAAAATAKYADNNRQTCDISDSLLNQLQKYHRDAVQARDNVCAGRPLRPYPPDIIRR
jgi:sigma54-dependent transcription regulator